MVQTSPQGSFLPALLFNLPGLVIGVIVLGYGLFVLGDRFDQRWLSVLHEGKARVLQSRLLSGEKGDLRYEITLYLQPASPPGEGRLGVAPPPERFTAYSEALYQYLSSPRRRPDPPTLRYRLGQAPLSGRNLLLSIDDLSLLPRWSSSSWIVFLLFPFLGLAVIASAFRSLRTRWKELHRLILLPWLLLPSSLALAETPDSTRSPFLRYLRKPPTGFVSLPALIPSLVLDIRYHTADNFTGAPLPGYGAPGAWMLEEPAQALARVQDSLRSQGLGLLIHDAYRPVRGTLAMVAWAKRTSQEDLLRKGYIATRSGHNHGHTIDLSLIDLKTKQPLDMGTPYDTLSKESHTYNAKGIFLKRRLILLQAMKAQGFRPYTKEWWHFSYKMKTKTRPRDVPYSCFEPPEKRWKAPQGWSSPGYKMPATWTASPCPRL